MKAIYSGCILDPWLKVAKKLKNEHNIEPVYWIGWNKENEDKIVKAEFPNIIFQDLADSWRGIFADETNLFKESVMDGEFIIKNAFHELTAIKMMDRMDPERRSFNFNERQRHYRRLVRRWLSIIDDIKPGIIISASVPHRIYDYALYVAAKERKVLFITYKETSIPGLLIPLTEIYTLPKEIFNYRKSGFGCKDLSQRAKEQIEKNSQSYKSAEPEYMKNNRRIANYYQAHFQFKEFLNQPAKYFRFLLNIFRETKTCFKKKSKNIEDSTFTFFEVEVLKWKGRKYKKRLKKYYESLTKNPDLKQNYIFIALHYQPEATSTPSGTVYTDQFLMIDMLSKCIPKDWQIFIKEHKTQFHPLYEGESSRERQFYDDVLKLKNTKFVPIEYDTFKLLDNSQAVATLTGTIGFESAVRGKPVLAFGNAWYSPLESVFSVTNRAELDSALSKIKDGIKIELNDIYRYLAHLEKKVGIHAYHYKGIKESSNITEKESVDALSKSIIDNLKS